MSYPTTKDSRYFIFGVGENDIIRESQFRAWMADKGFGFKNVFVVDNETQEQERGFITNVNNYDAIEAAQWLSGQENILILMEADRHGYREAAIADLPSWNTTQIGKWSSVTPHAAKNVYPMYVYDIESGLYFVALGKAAEA